MLKYDPSSRVARRKRRITVLKRIMPLYIMLIPAIVYVIVFSYYPMYGAQIAFRNFKITLGIWDSPWVGFDYFIRFFNSFNFTRIFTNTLYLSVYSLIASTVVVVSLSLILHCVLRDSFKRLVQTVIYLPHFISTVVIVGIVLRMLNPSLGVISKLIQFFGGTSRDLMGIAPAFSHIYVWSGIWQNAGYGTVIYLAALASADAEHHEAAMIDGASRLQRLIHIDIPVLIPTIVIMLIMNLGRLIDVGYEKILLMQNNLNLQRSEVIATYVYKIGLASNMPDYSLSTAVGLFNSVISLVLVVTVNTIAKKLTATSLW
jgi:ABC-type polysaccharide transport system permease subunit